MATLIRLRTGPIVALASMILATLALVLLPPAQRQPAVKFLIANCGNALVIVACAAIGLLIVTRAAGNPIGWIYLLVSLAFAAGEFTGSYAARAQTGTPRLPGAVWAAWLTDLTWLAAVPLGATLLLLQYPTGQPPSSRWRPIIWVAATATVAAVAAQALLPNALHKYYPTARNPLGLTAARPLLNLALQVAWVLIVACLIAAALSLFARWCRAGGVERQQLKWLACAAILLVVVEASGSFVPHLLFQAVVLVAALLFPAATALAILRYRLYAIDRLINRTLVYGLLTALLGLIYTVLVSLVGILLDPRGGQSPLTVAISTLIVATLVQPARRHVQAQVDRRFNRRRYDAAKTIESFSARLRNEIDLDTLSAELLTAVNQTVEPTRVSLWLRPPVNRSWPPSAIDV